MLTSGRGEGGSKDTRKEEITLAVAGMRHNQRLDVLIWEAVLPWILEAYEKMEGLRE